MNIAIFNLVEVKADMFASVFFSRFNSSKYFAQHKRICLNQLQFNFLQHGDNLKWNRLTEIS